MDSRASSSGIDKDTFTMCRSFRNNKTQLTGITNPRSPKPDNDKSTNYEIRSNTNIPLNIILFFFLFGS
jgi:hypothetical protein